MKRIVLSAILATSFVSTFALAGAPAAQANIVKDTNKANIGQVIEWTKAKTATVVDASDADTRGKFGSIPGAVLLTSSTFAATELPADKATKLVFYSANASSTAADAAARRATELGYTNVLVLQEGIMGWKKAGQPSSTK